MNRRAWIDADEFEDAIAATNLLPGPGSTQLSIYCAWRLRGAVGAAVGGLSFILPGLVVILALSSLFLATAPPRWVLAAGAGAGAAVAAVALSAAAGLIPSSWSRAPSQPRWITYTLIGALATIVLGPLLVLVLLACGAVELAVTHRSRSGAPLGLHAWPVLLAAAASVGGVGALVWVALKVGALSYGGGFVIIPLMQHDAVDTYHWMTDGQFLNAVALGQITPGPVVHTVAVVGYAAAGIGGGLLATAVAFAPSFSFILIGADRFDRLRADDRVRAFLNGTGPAAIGAIGGSAVPLAGALDQSWQLALLAAAVLTIFSTRGRTVLTLLGAAAIGVVAVQLLGAELP